MTGNVTGWIRFDGRERLIVAQISVTEWKKFWLHFFTFMFYLETDFMQS